MQNEEIFGFGLDEELEKVDNESTGNKDLDAALDEALKAASHNHHSEDPLNYEHVSQMDALEESPRLPFGFNDNDIVVDPAEPQVEAQGVTDILKFLDREVVEKVVDLIKGIDVNQIQELIKLIASMVEIKANGDVYLNLRIKVKDGDPND